MEELLARALRGALDGLSGPMRFRFILQPLVAILVAFRAGRRDARTGQPPFLWAVVLHHGHRKERAAQAWRDVWRVFLVAVLVDFSLQVIVHQRVVPLQAVFVATTLALVPYVLVCGPINRLERRLWRRTHA